MKVKEMQDNRDEFCVHWTVLLKQIPPENREFAMRFLIDDMASYIPRDRAKHIVNNIRRALGIYHECPNCHVRKFDEGLCIFCSGKTTREPGEVYVDN